MYGHDKMAIRKKALAGMLKKGPAGAGSVKPRQMMPLMEELDGMQDALADGNENEMEDGEQKQGAEFVQFMVSPKEKEMILSM